MTPAARPPADSNEPTDPAVDETPEVDAEALALQIAADLATKPPTAPVDPHAGLTYLVNDTNPAAAGWYPTDVAGVLLGDDDALGWRRARPADPSDGGNAGDEKE